MGIVFEQGKGSLANWSPDTSVPFSLGIVSEQSSCGLYDQGSSGIGSPSTSAPFALSNWILAVDKRHKVLRFFRESPTSLAASFTTYPNITTKHINNSGTAHLSILIGTSHQCFQRRHILGLPRYVHEVLMHNNSSSAPESQLRTAEMCIEMGRRTVHEPECTCWLIGAKVPAVPSGPETVLEHPYVPRRVQFTVLHQENQGHRGIRPGGGALLLLSLTGRPQGNGYQVLTWPGSPRSGD